MSQPQATTPVAKETEKRSASRAGILRRAREGGIIYPFILLFVILAIWKGSTFYGKTNLLEILDQQSATLIIAAAGTMVLVAGGIDLSVGSTYSLAGVTSGWFALRTNPALA